MFKFMRNNISLIFSSVKLDSKDLDLIKNHKTLMMLAYHELSTISIFLNFSIKMKKNLKFSITGYK